MKTFVIAEAGVNHNGDRSLALELVDAAKQAGADAVKFQTFRAERVALESAPAAEYQQSGTGRSKRQVDILRELELGEEDHEALLDHCRKRGIRFLSTAFDALSADFLFDRLGLDQLKVPSGEITNAPFLLHLARKRRPLIVSTGLASLGEVEEALGVLAYGLTESPEEPSSEAPSRDSFARAYASAEGAQALESRVTLLHCTSEYPAPLDQVNLRAMDTLHSAFGLPVGLSDHSEGIFVAIAAVARGATVVEKHFTLSRSMKGPDHAASLEPGELTEMVKGIREVELALGTSRKAPTPGELGNRDAIRRSLFAARAVPADTPLESADIAVLRPGTGVSPMEYWSFLGRRTARALAKGEPLE